VSDSVPDRTIAPPPPRPRAAEPDLSRMLAKAREAATPPAPTQLPQRTAAPATAAAVPEEAAQTAPVRSLGNSRPKAQAPKASQRESSPAPEAETPKVGVNLYLEVETNQRARAAYKATAHLEGDASWSAFVDTAVRAETARREKAHNDGKPFPQAGKLRTGRPLKD
jgi:hypothetical protein